MSASPLADPAIDVFEVLPRDLSPYRKGNTGIDYVHRFESGRPGPHVLVNALTHGNEFCGMVAATHLLDREIRPRIGTLTVSFANVAAYETFDRARPLDSRQIVHNFNRIWSAEWLDGKEDSPELRRAREMRPALDAADHVLDLHSTSQAVEPFWVYQGFGRNAQMALSLGLPAVHLVMPSGLGSGVPVIQYGQFADPAGRGVAAVAECGQHFHQSSADVAVKVTLGFLAHFGLIEADARPGAALAQRRFELLQTYVIRTPDFRFTRPCAGFEVFARGELIATDGEHEVRAPCDDCTILMPARVVLPGREGVYLSRPIP